MIIVPSMAVATPKLTIITVFLIIFFTNPFVCFCRCPLQESEALLSLNFTSIPTYLGTKWTNETDCCEWGGITCDQNKSHVEGISVHDSGIDTSDSGVILDSLCKLPFLTDIDLQEISTSLTAISIPSCVGDLHYLQYLMIRDSGLSGVIPLSICMLINLTYLNLGENQLSGSLPFCLNNLSSLSLLSLSNNRLSGQIPFTWGNLPLLELLDVSFNQLSGTLPLSFSGLSSLTILYAHGNKFNESSPSWALPSSIGSLSLSLNQEITISETFFHNLSNLQEFFLFNCTLNISTSWIPNFQLSELQLVSCQMGGQIPPWISTQFSLESLTLANNGLAGEIPAWLWAMTSLYNLNLSRNHLQGPLFPNGQISIMSILDVSSNALCGHLPSVWPKSRWPPSPSDDPVIWGNPLILMLNDNLFTGNIPPGLCNASVGVKLSLENNKLDGMIPWCLIDEGSSIQNLNLGGNNLEGRMPHGLIVSSHIMSLVLKNNQLTGAFLPSFTIDIISGRYPALQVLDIGHNKFTGHLPKSIGNISSLRVLVMKDNQFNGNILTEIGELNQLQILDLSSNNLSGSIPHNIVLLRAMAVAREDGYQLQSEQELGVDGYSLVSSLGGLDMTSKGTELYYPYILSTLTGIDLSNNQLNGDVPLDFGKLKGLRFLNLSMNHLSGIIPHSLGDMSQLESLDLSSNHLSGDIPSELQSLSYLAYLNLSKNSLSGNIPQGGQMITFENTSYSGNPNLDGCPLPKNCSWPKFATPPPVSIAEHKDEEESEQIPWYQIGVGWSYGAGFLIVVVVLLSVSERWRKKYFKGVDNTLMFLFPFLHNRRL
ncbi:receptor-like protein 7 [Cryptomeria japonica]|uniref:receptor-like protein 7 n=1 Tax=Cryptomeria japonica TaxID=3369 RepID=UPI0027DA8D69|nr:receptor-like protein 7 [Cryptomeria japonica]